MKYRLNQSLLCASVVCSIAALGGYLLFKKSVSPQHADEFVVGMAAGYAPFVSINPQGDYEGFDIDVARALAETMGKKLVLKDLGTMPALFVALDQKTIDTIIWGLEMTPDRMQKVAMIRYQGDVTRSYPLIFWNKIPTGITSLEDMRGKTVCVEPASSQDAFLNKYDFITKLPVDKVDDALLLIQYGKADAALIDPVIAKKFKNKYPDIKILDLPLEPKDQVQGIGIVVKPDNNELIEQIKKAVAYLQSTGFIAQLEQKWSMV